VRSGAYQPRTRVTVPNRQPSADRYRLRCRISDRDRNSSWDWKPSSMWNRLLISKSLAGTIGRIALTVRERLAASVGMLVRSLNAAIQERLTSRMSRIGQSGALFPEHCAIVLANSLSSLLRSVILERMSSRWCDAISRTSAHDAFPGAPRASRARMSSRPKPSSRPRRMNASARV
jgi:hypothetical protein